MKVKRFFYKMTRNGFFSVFIIILLLFISIFNIYNNIIQNNKTMEVKNALMEKIDTQTDILLEAGHAIGKAAITVIIDEIEEGNVSTRNRINMTDMRIQRINTVYSNLLTEMEKRTVDSLYSESLLIDMEKEAAIFFQEGNYIQAMAHYAAVAEAQRENNNARFYYLYSLFLNNKMDRNNYQTIKEGLLALETHGYLRREIKDVLDFINYEEAGFENLRELTEISQ